MKNIIEQICKELYNTERTSKNSVKFKNEVKNLNVGQIANYFALRNFFNYTHKKAYNLVISASYDEINKITKIHSSIEQLVESFKKYFLKNYFTTDLMDVITGNKIVDDDYFNKMSDYIKASNNCNLFNIYLKILLIANDIHDNWVMKNAYKYDRDINKLFQHLPLVLIGEKELKKDLIFIAPLFDKLKIPLISKYYSKHYIINEFLIVYESVFYAYLKKYKFNFYTKNWDMVFAKMIKQYKALKICNSKKDQKKYASKRKKFMNEKSTRETLTKLLITNNLFFASIINVENSDDEVV